MTVHHLAVIVAVIAVVLPVAAPAVALLVKRKGRDADTLRNISKKSSKGRISRSK